MAVKLVINVANPSSFGIVYFIACSLIIVICYGRIVIDIIYGYGRLLNISGYDENNSMYNTSVILNVWCDSVYKWYSDKNSGCLESVF